MSSDYNPDTGKFPEDSPKKSNVLKGPFMEIPDYEEIKKFAAETEKAMGKAREALHKRAAAQLEECMTTAVDNALGKGNWTHAELEGRMVVHSYDETDVLTVTLDGEPILAYGPLKLETVKGKHGLELNAQRFMKVLNGEGGAG